MDKINVLIVEDEWIVSEEIKELLTESGFKVVGQSEDGESALEIIKSASVDVALLDINIKGSMDGIELANKILDEKKMAIIFLTAFDDDHFINRAKQVKPAAYIVKPYQARNLEMAIEMAFNNIAEANQDASKESFVVSGHIFLRDSTRFKKIALDSIQYAEAVGSYTNVYFENGKHTLSINLKTFHNKLHNALFLRVHRSFVVNLNHIDEYEGNRIFIKGKAIPISSSYKNEFLQKFNFL